MTTESDQKAAEEHHFPDSKEMVKVAEQYAFDNNETIPRLIATKNKTIDGGIAPDFRITKAHLAGQEYAREAERKRIWEEWMKVDICPCDLKQIIFGGKAE